MKKLINSCYRYFVSAVKRMDKATNYKIGDFVRNVTNVNTRKYWNKYLHKRGDFWRDFPYRFLLDELPKDERFSLLDIGCALGDGCRMLKKNFPLVSIFGADLSPLAVKKAKLKCDGEIYFNLDISKEEPPQKYDYITLIHIIEHFNEPFSVLDKCLKFVNKAVYISTPYGEDFEDPRLYWKGEHRYLFNEKTFINYNCKVLKVTERIEEVGVKYILYKITP